MEELEPRRSSGHRRKKRRSPSYQPPYFRRSSDSDDMMTVYPANSTFSSQSIIIYYTLLFLKVGLWVVFAWILSYLHLGAPCFLLPLTIWLYSGPMRRALKWAKRRLRGPVT